MQRRKELCVEEGLVKHNLSEERYVLPRRCGQKTPASPQLSSRTLDCFRPQVLDPLHSKFLLPASTLLLGCLEGRPSQAGISVSDLEELNEIGVATRGDFVGDII
jgi:hypothetical protein